MYASDDLYTLRQAAAFLSVSEVDVRRMVQGGKLRAWSLPNSKTMLVRKRDLLPFLDPGAALPVARQLPMFGDERQTGAA
jgi:excisionase family DNA binding protein